MMSLGCKRFLSQCLLASFLTITVTGSSAQTTTTCTGLPGSYVKLVDQPYALCAGAETVNFDEITYAKCAIMKGTSISATQAYPFPKVNLFNSVSGSGNIATVNQGAPTEGGYMVSTYSPPAGALETSARPELALYTCNDGGTYAQCDGGLCFTSTIGRSSPLWGDVRPNQIICSCPVTTTKTSFQVFGPGRCPKTQAEYDRVCAANASAINNGAILYIGAPTGSPEALARCVTPREARMRHCDRPAN